jgi:glycosyltransferase involved in cell wall biosynthesis
MKKRSVLFLTNTYPDFESSYRGIFIKELALRLQKEECAITVVTPKIYRESPRFEKQNGIKVYRFPFFSGGKLLIEYQRVPYLRMIVYFLSGVLFALYATLKHRGQLIHAHWAIPTGLIGVLVATLLRKPLLVTVHGSDLRMAIRGPGLLTRTFRYVCKRAGHVISVSEGMKREMKSLGIPDEKITVSPMGVEEIFFTARRKDEDGAEERPFIILSNRNLQPVYNLSQLVEAAPEIIREEPRVKIFIAGEGRERDFLEKKVEDLKVGWSVQFLGRVPHKEMPHLLAKADVYVSTSLQDGTSVSLLEAMAAGAFPVVTDIPANREWIKDRENGFLVPVKDKTALAEKIVEALRNPSLRATVRQMNRGMASERADSRSQTKRMLGIYQACCS